MSIASSYPPDILRVVYVGSGMRRGAADTFIIYDKPRAPIRIGDIIEIDILDGYRYRTWDVRITCVRVLEEEMIELAGLLHGPDDGAIRTHMLFQCPRNWVHLGWLTLLRFRLFKPPTLNTIPRSHPIPASLCSIKAFRKRYRGSLEATRPERFELVGGMPFMIASESTASITPSVETAME